MTIYEYLIKILSKHNKSVNDIVWVGCKKFRIEKEFFYRYIKSHGFYDEKDNASCLMLPYELLIVGSDFWIEIETHEFADDTLVYKSLPVMPQNEEKLLSLSTSEIITIEELDNFDLTKPDEANIYYRCLRSDDMDLLLDCTRYKMKSIKNN